LRRGVRELVIHDTDESRVTGLLSLLADLGEGRVAARPPTADTWSKPGKTSWPIFMLGK
jgi:hypothetical protein